MQKKIKDDAISRQAAIDAIKKRADKARDMVGSDHPFWEGLIVALDIVEQLPSAQPEIIRCKDCKWSDWYDSTDGNRYCYCMETGASGRTANDFCSYAERRTDAETEV